MTILKNRFKADAIKLITRLALETQTLKRTVKQLKANQPTLYSIDDITGSSGKIKQTKHQLEEYAQS